MTVIPSIYRGVKMRSKSEAKFAEWCDQHELKWAYEPEGFCAGGQSYLPDFYLSEIRTFVEIKPLIFIKECSKMLPIIASPQMYGFCFLIVDMHPKMTPLYFWEEWCDECSDGLNPREDIPDWAGNFAFNWCSSCKKPIICSWGSWACRHCGLYDGDGHLLLDDPFIKEQPTKGSIYGR